MESDKKCPNCEHPESDHKGYWSDGTLIPGKRCFYMENQGYQQDLCGCPGFDATEPVSYLETLLGKAGVDGTP